MDKAAIAVAFEDIFDQALLFHGFAEHMRDYDLYVYATADPATGIPPTNLRYRFLHCVRAVVTTTVGDEVWPKSLDERLLDHQVAEDEGVDGYVWGVEWQLLYPGLRLVDDSPIAQAWASRLGIAFHEAVIECNAHQLELVFADLNVKRVPFGTTAHVVSAADRPDAKWYFHD